MGAQGKDPGGASLARVARLCALPIGVLAWRAPEPTLTVIVKATFALGADGAATLAAVQEPLSLDRPAAGGSFGDLDRACDFIPLKARVDLLLTGHARAEAATLVLPAGFAVDKLRRRFYAAADEPTAAAPLTSEYVRSSSGDVARVGPRALWAGTLDGAAIVGDDGVPCAPIPRGFDYAAFNVAPPEQQIELLSLTAQIALEGLTPGGRCVARLPGIRPRVFVLPADGFISIRPPEEVVLRCDTLWIDADRALCVLTWRGVVPLAPGARGAPSLVLALDEGDRKKTWARAMTELESAAWTAATEPDDVRESLEPDLDDGPTTDRMQREAAALDAEQAAPSPTDDDDDDESTRTDLRLPLASVSAIDIDDDPSTIRPGSIPAIDVPAPAPAIARAPLMVLGGLRSALASFEVKLPPARPQRPVGLHFTRFEDDDTVFASEPPVPAPSAPTAPPPGSSMTLPLIKQQPSAPLPGSSMTLPFVKQPIAAPPPGSSMTLPFVKQPIAAPPGSMMTLPFARPATSPAIPFSPSSTLSLEDPDEPPPISALPFAKPPGARAIPKAIPFSPSTTLALEDPDEPPPVSALPFVKRAAALAFEAPINPAPPFARTNTIALDPAYDGAAPALPFTPSASLLARARGEAPSLPALGDLPSAPPPPAAAPEVSWAQARAPARTVGESITSAADAAPDLAKAAIEPAVEAAPSAMSLEAYAEIKAEIWGSRASVANVLQLHDLDEATFHDHERRLADALAREAAEGQSTLAIALRDALRLARDRQQSTGERPLRTLEVTYVTLLAALDRADDPSAILASKGMSPAEWHRLRRRFEERTGTDAKLRDALSTRLATARKVADHDTGNSSTWWNRRETAPSKAKRVPAKRKA